jgi:malonate decarboxylase epsilon subunit
MIDFCATKNGGIMKTVFLFPGQGSQRTGMLRNLRGEDAIVSDVYDQVRETLRQDPMDLDSEEKLSSTVYAQVCLLISSVISARRLQARGVSPDFVAGHSVGSFSAAVISGVLTVGQALSIVHERGVLMEKAYPHDYGMAAFTGMSEQALDTALGLFARAHGRVWLANVNSADQMVVAGKTVDLVALIRQLEGSGIQKAALLKVAVPSHCPLMQGVSDALQEKLEGMELKDPFLPYGSNHTGRVLRTSDAIREDLYKSVAATLRWHDVTSVIYELGARLYIETEPSGVLAKIAAKSFPEAKVVQVNGGDPDATAWLWKRYQEADDE